MSLRPDMRLLAAVFLALLLALPARAQVLNYGDVFESPSLTGDWGGVRSRWEKAGVQLGGDEILESLGNSEGRSDAEVEGRFELFANLDLEKLMGWQVNNGLDQLGAFYPASEFHKAFYRPDVIRRVLAEGRQGALAAPVLDDLAPVPGELTLKPHELTEELEGACRLRAGHGRGPESQGAEGRGGRCAEAGAAEGSRRRRAEPRGHRL